MDALFDVGSQTTGGCDPMDICCLDQGETPPHVLLDAFLLAYPAVAMPKTAEAVLAFEPMAEGHAMAWSPSNTGDEFVDPANGGIAAANIDAGRMVSLEAAEAFVPAGAVIVAMREDAIETDPPAAMGGCVGTGWGWGSILFEDLDGAIGELVYLYIGQCTNEADLERFFHSDQAVRVCDATG